MLGGVISSSPQQVRHFWRSNLRICAGASGVSTIELILTLVLLISVVGSTMYYLRSVLPGLEARALATYTFENGALGPGLLGARIGYPQALPSGSVSDQPRIQGPLSYFADFPGSIDGVASFETEVEGLLRLLSATTAAGSGSSESWCIALFDPWTAPLNKYCQLGASHLIPGFEEIGPAGACSFTEQVGDCLYQATEPFLRAHGCKFDSASNQITAPGLRPLLIGLYPIDSEEAFAAGCAVRTVDLPRTHDIRHKAPPGP